MKSTLLLTSLALAALTPLSAVTFDFNSDNQFSDNFHAYSVPNGAYAQDSGTGKLTWTTAGAQTGTFVYDANGSAAGSTNLLLGVGNSLVVEFDFSSDVSNVGIGVFFGGARTSEYLALLNLNNSGTNDQLRIFGARDWNLTTPSVNGTTGTTVANESLTGGGWTTNATYHATFTMTYTSATTVDVSYVITDPAEMLASFSATATGLTVSETANEIGFRLGSSASASVISLDNLSITSSAIPEPSAFALLGGAGVLGLALVRRRRHG